MGKEKRVCRVCGCTDDNCSKCIKKTGKPCYWVKEDLCSACAVFVCPICGYTYEDKDSAMVCCNGD